MKKTVKTMWLHLKIMHGPGHQGTHEEYLEIRNDDDVDYRTDCIIHDNDLDNAITELQEIVTALPDDILQEKIQEQINRRDNAVVALKRLREAEVATTAMKEKKK